MHKPVPVIAFEMKETYVFESIADAATNYGVNKKIIVDRINDGCTLKDGYTTLDWLMNGLESNEALVETRAPFPSDNLLECVA